MRIEPETRGRLSGFEVGEKVRVESEMSDGSLLVTVGTIERIGESGVTLLPMSGNVPLTFTWRAVRTIGKRT